MMLFLIFGVPVGHVSLLTVEFYPWLLMPMLPVILTILAFNFFGDGLRDAADPYT